MSSVRWTAVANIKWSMITDVVYFDMKMLKYYKWEKHMGCVVIPSRCVRMWACLAHTSWYTRNAHTEKRKLRLQNTGTWWIVAIIDVRDAVGSHWVTDRTNKKGFSAPLHVIAPHMHPVLPFTAVEYDLQWDHSFVFLIFFFFILWSEGIYQMHLVTCHCRR